MPFKRDSEESKGYKPPRLTDKQMRSLEYLIAVSRGVTGFARRVVIWVLRQTNNLTEPVTLSIPEEFLGEPAGQVQDAVHSMCSSGGTTHLTYVFGIAGTEMRLQHHCGRFVDGGFYPHVEGRTIWCAYEDYSRTARLLTPPTPEDLDKIDLE